MIGKYPGRFRGHDVTVYNWMEGDTRVFFVVHHYDGGPVKPITDIERG